MSLYGMIQFLTSACTDLALIPALTIVFNNKRHFEFYVGAFQLFSSFCFNFSNAMDIELFLKENDWHFISDVLSISYVCCLLIHLMGNSDESTNIVLRYAAFSLSWIAKLKDSWDHFFYQGVLIFAYLVMSASKVLTLHHKYNLYDTNNLFIGVTFLCLALVCFMVELEEELNPFKLVTGIAHVFAGAAFYYLYQVVEPLSMKKKDLPFSNSDFI